MTLLSPSRRVPVLYIRSYNTLKIIDLLMCGLEYGIAYKYTTYTDIPYSNGGFYRTVKADMRINRRSSRIL